MNFSPLLRSLLFSLLCILVIAPTLRAQQVRPQLAWVHSCGSSFAVESANAVRVDGSGNVYSMGLFQGTADFDPGPGTVNLVSRGGHDVFVMKQDSTGKLLWARSAGSNLTGTSNDDGFGLAVDAQGSVYVSGTFRDSMDFDPGPRSAQYLIAEAKSFDAFVWKLDSAGNFLWARRIGGNSYDVGNGIDVDSAGNSYTIGEFGSSSVDFDSGPGTYRVSRQGSTDAFVLKLDPSGNFVWVKTVGGTGSVGIRQMMMDRSGNIYASGGFSQTADFNPGPGKDSLTATISAAYILKLDSAGRFGWVRRFGGTGHFLFNALALHPSGKAVAATGNFNGTADFDPGPGVYNMTGTTPAPSASGSTDIFTVRLDSAGSFKWAKSWGSGEYDHGSGIAFDTAGHVYTTGLFYDTVDFDPGPDTFLLSDYRNYDMFITKLDDTGAFVWAANIGGDSSTVNSKVLAVDKAGNIYAGGYYYGACDFDPGPAVHTARSHSNSEIFVLRLRQLDTARNNHDSDTISTVRILEPDRPSAPELQLYPNPATERITLSNPDAMTDARIRVFNVSGQVQQTRIVSDPASFTMDVSQLPGGMYFIEIIRKEGVQRLRFLKR